MENRITFRIKRRYFLKLLTLEMTKLLGCTKSKINKGEKGKNVPHLKITEIVLAHCYILNNDYQHYSRVLYIFVPNKLFGQFLYILPKKLVFLKTFSSNFWIVKSDLLIKTLNH